MITGQTWIILVLLRAFGSQSWALRTRDRRRTEQGAHLGGRPEYPRDAPWFGRKWKPSLLASQQSGDRAADVGDPPWRSPRDPRATPTRD